MGHLLTFWVWLALGPHYDMLVYILCSMTTSEVDTGEGADDKKRHEAWRRYSEFEALRHFLCAVYPHIVIPPLPEKDVRVLVLAQEHRDTVSRDTVSRRFIG